MRSASINTDVALTITNTRFRERGLWLLQNAITFSQELPIEIYGALSPDGDLLADAEMLSRVSPDRLQAVRNALAIRKDIEPEDDPLRRYVTIRNYPFDVMAFIHSFIALPLMREMYETLDENGISTLYVVPWRDSQGFTYPVLLAPKNASLTILQLRVFFVRVQRKFDFLHFKALAPSNDDSGNTLLSARERDCLCFTAKGATEREIADQMNISMHTVRAHLENAKRKLGARNKPHAITLAYKTGEIRLLDSLELPSPAD